MQILITGVLMLGIVGVVIGIYVASLAIRISLGNIGDVWGRIPQNTCLVITKHKTAVKVYYSVTDEKWKNIQKMIKRSTGKKGMPAIEHVRVGLAKEGFLGWVGFSFSGKDVYEWFETEYDERNRIKALHSIDFSENVIEYPPQDKKKELDDKKIVEIQESKNDPNYGVPSYKSADNIEIRTSLTIFFIVVDPIKALFSIRYRKQAIKEQVFPKWRDVLGGHSFFVYEKIKPEGKKRKSGKKVPVQISSNIRIESNNALRKALGLVSLTGQDKSEIERIIDKYPNWEKERIGNENMALDPDGMAKKLFYDEWGILLTDVTVGELEAADPGIEQALGEQMKARTVALAKIEKGKGEKEFLKLLGEGKNAEISLELQAMMGEDEKNRPQALQILDDMRNYEAFIKLPSEGRQTFFQWPRSERGSSPAEALASLGISVEEIKKFLEAKK